MENNTKQNSVINKIFKTFLKYFICTLILGIVFLLLLYVTALIPKESIEKNVNKSAEILVAEGKKKFFKNWGETRNNDNHTDAIMINTVYSIDNKHILESIIKDRRNYNPGLTQEIVPDTVGNLKYENRKFDMVIELKDTVDGVNQKAYEYSRYWHGYMIILRPLLLLFDINGIRIIFQSIVLILLAILSYLLIKQKKIRYCVFLLITFIFSDLFNYYQVIQGIFVIIIALIYSILIALKKINDKNIYFSMFIVGAITQYLDFLTTPILTLLLPIMIYFIVNEENISIKESIKIIIKACILWGLGYVILWALKWIIAELTFCSGIIKMAFDQIQFRLIGKNLTNDVKSNSVYSAIRKNLVFYFNNINYKIFLLGLFLYVFNIIWGVIILKYNKQKYVIQNKLLKFVSMFCVIIVLLWYCALTPHADYHFFFTYRNLLVLYFASMIIFMGDFTYLKQGIELIKNKEKK